MARRDKHNYYLDIAESVLQRGTCLKRNFGSVIVRNDEIISTGYNGAPRRRKNCLDLGFCIRDRKNIPGDQMYEMCRSVHSEVNAIISAPRHELIGSTLYLVGKDRRTGELVKETISCPMCKKIIINAGIEQVIVRDTRDEYRYIHVQDWIDNDETLNGTMEY